MMSQGRPRTAPTGPTAFMESESSRSATTFNPPQHATLHAPDEEPSFTFVCLGVGGGPLEGDCSCYMLKPAHREWSEGAVVVEGGSWLGALTRVLENVGPDSAFAEVHFPHDSPALRAGLVLGSASLPGKRKVFGLRPTLENLLDVFNGKIWPKLASFDDNGGPAVYILKAMENQVDSKVDEALTVVPFALSHGLNPSVPPAPPTPTQSYNMPSSHFSKRYSLPLNGYFPNVMAVSPLERGPSNSSGEKPIFTSPFAPERTLVGKMDRARIDEDRATDSETRMPPPSTGVAAPPPKSPNKSKGSASRSSRRPKTAQGSEYSYEDSDPGMLKANQASTSSTRRMAGSGTKAPPKRVSIDHSPPALDSTAFFITNNHTNKDVLFFGDVEPDCVSQSPRNKKVWAHAARRYVDGKLNTVFLECSFPAAHPTEFLYGHLSVKFLYDELRNLSRLVLAERKRQTLRRQKVDSSSTTGATPHSSNSLSYEGASYTRLASSPLPSIPASPMAANVVSDEELRSSLKGLSVVIIHVKMALFPSFCATTTTTDAPPSPSSITSFATAENGEEESSAEAKQATSQHIINERLIDPRTMQERILEELEEMEVEAGLGVQFVMAKQGMKIEC